MTLTQLLDEVNRLSADEQQQLRAILTEKERDGRRETVRQTTTDDESSFLERLVADGRVREVPHPDCNSAPFAPVQIVGRPLSETIVEDRR